MSARDTSGMGAPAIAAGPFPDRGQHGAGRDRARHAARRHARGEPTHPGPRADRRIRRARRGDAVPRAGRQDRGRHGRGSDPRRSRGRVLSGPGVRAGLRRDQRRLSAARRRRHPISHGLDRQDLYGHDHHAAGGAGPAQPGRAPAHLPAQSAPGRRVRGGAGHAAPVPQPQRGLARRVLPRFRARRRRHHPLRRGHGGAATTHPTRPGVRLQQRRRRAGRARHRGGGGPAVRGRGARAGPRPAGAGPHVLLLR
jgi:hypothetical protein